MQIDWYASAQTAQVPYLISVIRYAKRTMSLPIIDPAKKPLMDSHPLYEVLTRSPVATIALRSIQPKNFSYSGKGKTYVVYNYGYDLVIHQPEPAIRPI